MPKDYSRMDQINILIQKNIAQILQEGDFFQSNLGVVTVLSVKVSKDLHQARIAVGCVTSDPEHVPLLIKALNAAAFEIRERLKRTIRLKYTPLLEFYYNDAVVKAQEITMLIDKLTTQKPKEE